MDKTFQDLCENLTSEVKHLAKKQDLTVNELDSLYKAVKTVYYIKTMSAMEDYSNESSRDSYGRYSREGYRDNYSRGGDYSQGYDRRMDSYRYSGHGDKEHMIEELEQMMRKSQDSHEQNAIRECINRLRG